MSPGLPTGSQQHLPGPRLTPEDPIFFFTVVSNRGRKGGDASLNVTAVEGVALKVPIHVLHARQLHSVLVHTPADATFAATGGLTLGERQAAVRYPSGGVPRGSLLALTFPDALEG